MLSIDKQPRILILGSGTPDGGGSGPKMLIKNVKEGVLKATIAWLVTHYPHGGVVALWKENESLFLTYVFKNFPTRQKGEDFSEAQIRKIRDIYTDLIDSFWGTDEIQYIILSGWMKFVLWLPTEKVVNIHPGRVDQSFGGRGEYGDFAHQHAFNAYQRGDITSTALNMHFVDDQFDHGPIIAQQSISLEGCISWEEAKGRVVWATEHKFQLAVTKALLEGQVALKNGIVEWNKDFEFEDSNYHKGSLNWS